MELPNTVLVANMSEQNPARPLMLRGAAARGALTFFRLTREDNGIAQNIVWAFVLPHVFVIAFVFPSFTMTSIHFPKL